MRNNRIMTYIGLFGTLLKLIFKLSIVFIFSLLSSNPGYGQPPISLYGYSDLVFRDFSERRFPNGARENPPPTFVMLRTHILLNSQFVPDWRFFVNVRFQNGADLGTSSSHDNKGEIQLLESWFEYQYRPWLRVRGGQFLALFGYFNPRKFQSPIFNTVVLPVMYEEEFLRRTSAGSIIPPLQNLQISGELVFEKWRWGYTLYAGNGSTTDENRLDVNTNKGVGGRVWMEPSIRNLVLGVSAYSEKGAFGIRPHVDMKAMMQKAMASGKMMSDIVPILPIVQESESRRTLGFDARYLYGNFEIRGEFVKSAISGLALLDASAISDTTRTYTFNAANFSKIFYYLDINYTFFEKLTPYFEINFFEDPRHFVFRNKLTRWTVGAAFRPIPNVTIKTEWHDHQFGKE